MLCLKSLLKNSYNSTKEVVCVGVRMLVCECVCAFVCVCVCVCMYVWVFSCIPENKIINAMFYSSELIDNTGEDQGLHP